jgi:hypothetical protein
MKSHHVAFAIGVGLLVCASSVKDQEFKGWWMVGGLLFIALSFIISMTRK